MSGSDGILRNRGRGEIRALSGQLHPLSDPEKLLLLVAMKEFRAYCDESEDGSAFAIAGYIAPTAMWERFESAWIEALEAEGIPEFHAKPLNNGNGVFREWLEPKRLQVAERFAGLVADSGIQGFVSAIDLTAYDCVAAEFLRLRGQRYWKADFLAFQLQIEQMSDWLNEIDMPQSQKVAVIFDIRDTFSGAALEIYQSARASRKKAVRRWVGRIRSLGFADSMETTPIQAADHLAYEARKHFSEVVYTQQPRTPRPQWLKLYESGGTPVRIRHFREPELRKVLPHL